MDEPAGRGPVLVQMHRESGEPSWPSPVFTLAEEQPVGQRKEQEVDECLLVEPVTIRTVQATEPVHWLACLLG